ncbi:hypothetical protein MMC25_005583 [Agyrium rufum]|nr:hypothetical protein [Agyrium rufum]
MPSAAKRRARLAAQESRLLAMAYREQVENARKAEEERLQIEADVASLLAEPPKKTLLVNILEQVQDLVDTVSASPETALYVDAEGVELGRYGKLNILQIHVEPTILGGGDPFTFVIDVQILQQSTFDTPGRKNPHLTLREILEDPTIPVLLWDCRQDSDAVNYQFKVALAGVIDLQLMEVAARDGRNKYYLGAYGECVLDDAGLSPVEKKVMNEDKKAKATFIPEYRGNWDRLAERPMRREIYRYCAGDVKYMPALFRKYAGILQGEPTPLSGRRLHV